MRNAGKAILGLGLTALAGALIYSATRKAEAAPPEEEIIDADLRSSYIHWEGLTEWKKVYARYLNEWPADTDVTFAWEIMNTGEIGAYFQVYIFEPGSWLYLDPGDKVEVFEEAHTLALPVTPGYEYSRITILGRKLTGERVGAVWASDEFEIRYV